MKKSLLIALAAVAMVSANAQLKVAPKATAMVDASAKIMGVMNNVVKETAQKAEPGTFVKKAPKKVGANEAKYYRPRGTFYVNWDPEGGGYYMPFLQTKPFQELTFTNCSTAPMAGSTWTYQPSDETGQQNYVDETYEGQDFTYMWGIYQYPDVPTLSIPGVDSTYNCTQGAGVDKATGKITKGPFTGSIFSVVDSKQAFGDEMNSLANPHYYGESNRAYSTYQGFTAYNGCTAADGTDGEGMWFGRNSDGWNAFATAVEAPAQPYVLNRVYGYISWLRGNGEFDITCRVYRLDEMPQYCDSNTAVDPMVFDMDHLIATGVTTVTNDMLEDGYAIMPFDLEAYNEELDMDIQVTPEIDFPIMIVMSGYDVPECEDMSFLITTDKEDEGYGEMAYMLHCSEDGTITFCHGLNNFFTVGEMKVGTSIFMDVSMPFMVYNYNNETGEYTFPNEGGSYSLNDHEGISIYSDQAADAYYYELEDGGEVPEWLTLEIADGTGEFAGTVDVKATAAALPEGETYREAKVKFYYAGANLIYTFKQGEEGETPEPIRGDVNGDGAVGIDDVNAVINIMLGKADMIPEADLNGDGAAGIDDVNAIINIMLGK